MKNNYSILLSILSACAWAMLSGCTSVNTFPTIARPGDTVTLLIGGSEMAKINNVSAIFTDAGGHAWDLQALGLVRSVFDLRSDGRAYDLHYGSSSDKQFSWSYGHEPLQTVLVTDVPVGATPGIGSLSIAYNNINDNSGGAGNTFSMSLEIIPGTGAPSLFTYHHPALGDQPVNFAKLEPAPHAKVTFPGTTMIGAASLVFGFDTAVVKSTQFNIYAPEATVTSIFGQTQRMVYWHRDSSHIYVDIVAPQGIEARYLQFFVLHPRGLTGSPALNILSAQVNGTDGNAIAVTPALTYSP
jgi:hypothetical protein